MLGRPALENLPRWKPRGLGDVYGDCVQVVYGTFVFADLLAPWRAVFRGAISQLETFGAAHVAIIAAKLARFLASAQPVWPGAGCCYRFERKIVDERCVMRPAPEVARATLVSVRGGKFRSRALGHRSRDMVRAV